jgi:hypothetical protein
LEGAFFLFQSAFGSFHGVEVVGVGDFSYLGVPISLGGVSPSGG